MCGVLDLCLPQAHFLVPSGTQVHRRLKRNKESSDAMRNNLWKMYNQILDVHVQGGIVSAHTGFVL